jgi:hypothetical protein
MMMRILHQAPGGGHGHGSHGHGGHGHSHGGGEGNINVQAAFIHVLGDLLQSVGVMIAAAVVWAIPSAHIADPLCTLIFAVLVLFTTVGIVRQGLATLLNSVPAHISMPTIAGDLRRLPGVTSMHDLHIWSFGTGRTALSVHLVADAPAQAFRAALALARQHGIAHSTVQVETAGSGDAEACYESNEHADACEVDFGPLLEGTTSASVEGRGHGAHGHAHAAHGHAALDGHGHAAAHGHAAHEHGHGHGGHGHAAHGHSHGGGAHGHADGRGGGGHGHEHGHGGHTASHVQEPLL